MSQTTNNSLQFSINESVWLRDDAPAEEILSMALEPDITIEENVNDVTIRGSLRLTGEYKPADTAAVDDKGKAAPFRTIDEIIETSAGTALLEHHFPIDITIPSNRVPNLEDLFIVIESFDYELSERRHIQLQADLAITGLSNPNDSPSHNEPVTETVDSGAGAETEPVSREKTAEPVEKTAEPVEKTADPAEKNAEEISRVKTVKKDKIPEDVTKEQMETEKKAERLPVEEDSGDFDEMPTDLADEEDGEEESLAEFQYEAFRKPDPADDEIEKSEPQVALSKANQHSSENERPERSEEAIMPVIPGANPAEENSIEEKPAENKAEAQPEEKVASKADEANSLYLTQVLAGDDADQRTKVKLCIVQSGESLESISERYKVPVTSLLRRNQLTSGSIEAGQILYIPKAVKGSKDE
ncbi:LysM peptidoglycan-binding domain-containing protein [Sporolactobacillus sp. THM7-4]|nr:LysM peptidoglycan-binding domain-containing protein [Sporolactobacillus sp. THM7-4]